MPPTPARALTQAQSTPPVEPDLDRVEIEVDDDVWQVGVLGRSGGRSAASVPMLLLGFWPGPDARGAHARETLIVGRTLEALSKRALEAALGDSREPRAPIARPKREERRHRPRRDGGSGKRNA